MGPILPDAPAPSFVNLSALASASSAVLLVFVTLMLVGISRAPGWERARGFAFVAFTAALYSAGDVFTVSRGVPRDVQLWVSRGQFVAAALHGAAWLLYARWSGKAGFSSAPLATRLLAMATASLGVAGLWPGVALDASARVLEVPALGVTYAIFPLTLPGTLGGVLMLTCIALAFATSNRESWAGTAVPGWARVGFVAFFACAAVDFLSASGFIAFVPMAGIGFVASLLPVALLVIRGFVRNARRLDRLSRDLGEEVRARTEDVLRVQRRLAEAERHASVGRVAAAVAHDINNPLSWLVLNADLLKDYARRHPLEDEARESIDGIAEGANRIAQAVESLRARTRWSPGMRVAVSPERLWRMAVTAASPDIHRHHQVTLDFQGAPLVHAEEGQLMGALVEFVQFAVQRPLGGFAPGGVVRMWSATSVTGDAEVGFSVVGTRTTGGAWGRTTVAARHEQMPPLATVRAVIEGHGGGVEVLEEEDRWVGTLRLPASPDHVTADGRVGSALIAVAG